MKLDLDNPNVFETDITSEALRMFIAGVEDLPDDVITAMDEAQGCVNSTESSVAYLVIKVTR
jgi:hypothetical protein